MAIDLQKLIIAQESGGDNNAYNSSTKATGSMQITPVFVADVNRLGGRNYTLADMKNPAKARDAQQVWSEHYYREAEKGKGSALTDREKLMMHHGGPNGWKRPNAGYWVYRKSGRVWMSNARYADEAMMKGTGFVDTEDPEYRYGMSATPRPADMLKPPAAFDWNNPVNSAFAMIDAFGETWEAAARQNPTIAALSAMKNGSFDYRKDDDYNVFDDLEGYEGYAKSFINVESRHDADLIKRRIDLELKDREVLARSGAAGVVAGIASGILDPINFIPIGGAAVTTGRIGANILRSAGKVALAGAVAGTANEVIIQGLEETRTLEESAFNIAGATVLSGLLGAAVGALAGKQVDNLAAAIEKDLDLSPTPVQAAAETVDMATEIIEVPTAKDAGLDAPEIVRVEPPKISDLDGAYVDYQGIQGRVVRDETGYWIEEFGGERVLIESGESGAAISELGISTFPEVPKPGKMYKPSETVKTDNVYGVFESDVKEMNTYQEGLAGLAYHPDTSEFTYHGKTYRYDKVNVNKSGETVSITAINPEGKAVTIRNKEVIDTIELQKQAWEYDRAGEPLAEIQPTHIKEAFDELPEADKTRSRAYAKKDTSGRSKKGTRDSARKSKKDGSGRREDAIETKQPDDSGSTGKNRAESPESETKVMDEEAILNGEYRQWRLCE